MDCLRSVQDCIAEAAIEIFVVDNNSSDGSADSVKRDFAEVRLIRNHENTGFSAANNLALREATGRYVMLLNSDTLVHPGAFHEMIAFMEAHQQAGYCGPMLIRRVVTVWICTFRRGVMSPFEWTG